MEGGFYKRAHKLWKGFNQGAPVYTRSGVWNTQKSACSHHSHRSIICHSCSINRVDGNMAWNATDISILTLPLVLYGSAQRYQTRSATTLLWCGAYPYITFTELRTVLCRGWGKQIHITFGTRPIWGGGTKLRPGMTFSA